MTYAEHSDVMPFDEIFLILMTSQHCPFEPCIGHIGRQKFCILIHTQTFHELYQCMKLWYFIQKTFYKRPATLNTEQIITKHNGNSAKIRAPSFLFYFSKLHTMTLSDLPCEWTQGGKSAPQSSSGHQAAIAV